MVSSTFENKKRYLLSLYPDLEDGEFEDGTSPVSAWEQAPFERETAVSAGDSSTTEESIGSLSAKDGHDHSLEKPKGPFWESNKVKSHRSKTKSFKTALKSELCTLDESPAGISPDTDSEDDEHKRTFRFYVILVSSLLLVGMGVAIVVLSLTFVRKKSGDNPNKPIIINEDTSADNIFDATCDISEVEAICRLNKERELALSEIPKCIQDTFNLIYVMAGHDEYYQLESIKSLQSCSSEGMALKRLAAMEHTESSSGLLECEYTAFSWYYEYGELEWWTEEGAAQSDVCYRDDVICDLTTPEGFTTTRGEYCSLDTLSLLI